MPRGVPNRGRDAVWVARETFVCSLDGVQEVVHAGVTRVREGHRMLEAYRSYFEPVDTGVHYEVEQATSGPGEKRGDPLGTSLVP